eukprot:CAMPEP_0119156414 /NCGR_PEP_ID=MMETSP1310-20130426/52242_1 /TAXON_ID=464262 /ORGANISM="Genus nov. species nov., Strain RCC2339" /LENGTH=603 /DNA_ID=CAMNT_0007149027 /DNA_START=420 /DNA_END=2227 /DNA_ORIENTATION=+
MAGVDVAATAFTIATLGVVLVNKINKVRGESVILPGEINDLHHRALIIKDLMINKCFGGNFEALANEVTGDQAGVVEVWRITKDDGKDILSYVQAQLSKSGKSGQVEQYIDAQDGMRGVLEDPLCQRIVKVLADVERELESLTKWCERDQKGNPILSIGKGLVGVGAGAKLKTIAVINNEIDRLVELFQLKLQVDLSQYAKASAEELKDVSSTLHGIYHLLASNAGQPLSQSKNAIPMTNAFSSHFWNFYFPGQKSVHWDEFAGSIVAYIMKSIMDLAVDKERVVQHRDSLQKVTVEVIESIRGRLDANSNGQIESYEFDVFTATSDIFTLYLQDYYSLMNVSFDDGLDMSDDPLTLTLEGSVYGTPRIPRSASAQAVEYATPVRDSGSDSHPFEKSSDDLRASTAGLPIYVQEACEHAIQPPNKPRKSGSYRLHAHRDVIDLLNQFRDLDGIIYSENNRLDISSDPQHLSGYFRKYIGAPMMDKFEEIRAPLPISDQEGHAILTSAGQLNLKGLILLIVVKRNVTFGYRQDQKSATRANVQNAFRKALRLANEYGMRSVAVRCPVTSHVKKGTSKADIEEAMNHVLDDEDLFEGQERVLEVV